MNKIFQIYNSIPKDYSNKKLIANLLTFLTDKPKTNDALLDFIYKQTKDNIIDLLHLIGILNQKYNESQKIANTNKRKHLGIYYTDYSIARKLAKESLNKIKNYEIFNVKFYEPCAGTGIFVIAYIDEVISKFNLTTKNDIQRVINNIFYSDIDEFAIKILNEILPSYINKIYNVKIKINKDNYYMGDVLFANKNNRIKKINPIKIFKLKNGFDIVLTNPPYKLLKANSNKYSNEGSNLHEEEIKKIIDFIKDNNIYKYNSGTLNFYKLFVEEILENYTNKNSKIGLLIPVTLLNDKQSEKLRKLILENHKIEKIYTIQENNEFFPDICQSFTFFNIHKGQKTNNINMISNIIKKEDIEKKGFTVNVELFKEISDSKPIIIENQIGIRLLQKINKKDKIKRFINILNLRGELDLTFYKKYITKNKTSYRLIRGSNIDEFNIKNLNDYVNEDFMNSIGPKSNHVKTKRIACQQISNIHSKKRLKFTIVDKNYILGNSCNYLLIKNNLFNDNLITLDYLLGILNSNLLDWRFKLTNSNNHISNYEISELPIASPSLNQKRDVEKVVNLLKQDTENIKLIEKLNNLIFEIYNLKDKETEFINNKYL